MSHAFPAQVLTPRTLAIAAVDLAKLHGTLDCKCMGRVECERRGHYTGFRTAEQSRAMREGRYEEVDD